MALPSAGQRRNEMVGICYGDECTLGSQVEGSGDHRYFVVPRGPRPKKRTRWYPGDESGWARAWTDFAAAEPMQAAAYVQGLTAGDLTLNDPAPSVPLLTIPTIPGREIEADAGMVIGSVVIARNLFSDLGSDVKSAFGGRLGGMEAAIADGVRQARQQIYEDARRLEADAVVGVTVRVESVTDKGQAVLITGTAVRTRPTTASGDAG